MQTEDQSKRLGGCLNNIAAAELVDGSLCLVLSPSPVLYRFSASDLSTEDLPNIVAPPGGAAGRWRATARAAQYRIGPLV